MKYNALSIFGIGIGAAGVLFILFAAINGLQARPLSPANSSATAGLNDWVYAIIGIGMIITGALIAFLGQGRKPAKDPAAPL